MSPTARTLAFCRQQGWRAGVVERWLPHTKVRKDLFGCIDLVCLDGLPGVLGIQATSSSNMASRITKAKALDELRLWLDAGNRFECFGWAKRGAVGKRKLWTLRRVELTEKDLAS